MSNQFIHIITMTGKTIVYPVNVVTVVTDVVTDVVDNAVAGLVLLWLQV